MSALRWSEWRGFRIEWVGARALFWAGLAETLQYVADWLSRRAARANRRFVRRAHEYELLAAAGGAETERP